MAPLKLVVAAGQRLFADALGASVALGMGHEVVPVHPTRGLDVIDLVLRERPEVALIDNWLDGVAGPPVAAALRRRLPSCKVLLMYSMPDLNEVQSALDAGAYGVLPKTLSLDGVAAAIRDAGALHYPVCPVEGINVVINSAITTRLEGWRRWGKLTRREIEVLELLSLYGRRDAVARCLGSRRNTIDNHVNRILTKTGALSQADAIEAAREAGVLSSLPPEHGRPSPERQNEDQYAGDREAPGHAEEQLATGSHEPMRSVATGATVLIAHALPLFSHSLVLALGARPELTLLREHPGSALETIETARRLQPDVIVLDYWMPGLHGIGGVSQLVSSLPTAKVILLSWLQSNDHIREALDSKAVGFLPTSITVSELADAISLAQDGAKRLFADRVTHLLTTIAKRYEDADRKRTALASLTDREITVLRSLGRGLSQQQAARELSISAATVKVHVHNILLKTGARSSSEAVSMAQGCGLIPV